ncbi:MAG: radical SAM protein [Nitrososphaeria archaeon]
MSYIYHIVQFRDGSAYTMFDVCDWKCTYCIRNVSLWCSSLPEGTVKMLNRAGIKYLATDQIVRILKENLVKLVFLGGGEPTQDPGLKALMHALNLNSIESWLITNGELLNDEIFNLAKGITFSIKAFDEAAHMRLTGKSNRKVLENFERYGKFDKVTAETVFYPKLVDCKEIMKVAGFVHGVNPGAKFRVDPAVQIRDIGELKKCVDRVKAIHERTYYFQFEDKLESPKLLYPEI